MLLHCLPRVTDRSGFSTSCTSLTADTIVAAYLIFGALDVWGRLPVSFFLKDDLHWSPSQVRALLCPNLHYKLDVSVAEPDFMIAAGVLDWPKNTTLDHPASIRLSE